jgi:GGDEF domain-containing protein
MRNTTFFEDQSSQLLTAGAFDFVLGSALRRAVRSQGSLTLVLLETRRELEGLMVTADSDTVREIGQIVGREIRETDRLGHTGRGALGVMLLDTGFDDSTRVIDRLMGRIERSEFPEPLRIAVGAACCPTHAADPAGLMHQATMRPVVNWRPQPSLKDSSSRAAILT